MTVRPEHAGALNDALEEWDFGGDTIRLLVGAEQSKGAITIVEGTMHGGGPPLHIHDAEDEVYIVLEGVLNFQVGKQRGTLATGEVLWLPRGIPHTVANLSDAPCRWIATCAPGGIEQMLRAQSEYLASLPEGTAPDPAAMANVGSSVVRRAVGPPLS